MKVTTISFLIHGDSVYLSEKKRGFGQGFLNGYGGKVAEAESIEEAAVRELNEEAGVTADAPALEKVAIIDFYNDEEHIFECHVFFVRNWQGEPKESEEMACPELYRINQMPYTRMWKSDQAWLPLIFSGQKIRAQVRYQKGMEAMESFEYEVL